MKQEVLSTSRISANVKSAERVLDILELLCGYRDGLSQAEIRSQLDIPKSSLHALIHLLASRGYVEGERLSGRYKLGRKAFEVGSVYLENTDLRKSAEPVMKLLNELTSETINLAVLDGTESLYIHVEECLYPLRLVTRVGRRLPAHTTATGKAMLSGLTEGQLDQLYARVKLAAPTKESIRSLAELKEDLASGRKSSVYFEREETVNGIMGIASPIRDFTGSIIAAIGIGLPTVRFDPAMEPRFVRILKNAAEIISANLGYNGSYGAPTLEELERIWHYSDLS
jgi:IclR family transcriptional regulator, KDG regulon repressor